MSSQGDFRQLAELAREKARPGLLRGTAIGAGAFLATMLLIGAFGGGDHFSVGSFWGFVASIGMMASASVNEELVFRGVIFRFAQDRFGTTVSGASRTADGLLDTVLSGRPC